MSVLNRTFLARDDDELVGLEQTYQAQFVDTIRRSSEWQLDDEFLWAPGVGSESLSSDVEPDSSASEGSDAQAMAAEQQVPTAEGGPSLQSDRDNGRV